MSALNVRDLLAEPVLAGAHVAAGTAGLERPVLDVQWWEAEAGPTRGCVLVCGPGAAEPAYRLDALVRRANDIDASCLVLVAPTARPLLATVRLADRFALPLLLGSQQPATVLQELTVRVRAPELAEARVVTQVARRLVTRRTGVEILDTVAGVVGAAVGLLAADGAPLLGDAGALPAGLNWGRPVAQISDAVAAHPVLDPERGGTAAWLVGRLDRASAARSAQVAGALAVAEPHVRGWLLTQRARARQDALAERQLLTTILVQRDGVSRLTYETALAMGWQLQRWHVGIHVTWQAALTDGEREQHLRTWVRELAARDLPVQGHDHGTHWMGWYDGPAEVSPARTRAHLQAVRAAAAAMPRDLALAVGVGRPHPGPGGLAETLDEARDAALLAGTADRRPVVEHFDELGVARLLASWQGSAVTRSFAETALAPLSDSQSKVLLDTLGVYLECGGSVTETAGVLRAHRNTVTSRLQQVRDRLAVDLADPDQRLALQVACRSLRT